MVFVVDADPAAFRTVSLTVCHPFVPNTCEGFWRVEELAVE